MVLLDFGLQASTLRENKFVVLSHPIYGYLLFVAIGNYFHLIRMLEYLLWEDFALSCIR